MTVPDILGAVARVMHATADAIAAEAEREARREAERRAEEARLWDDAADFLAPRRPRDRRR